MTGVDRPAGRGSGGYVKLTRFSAMLNARLAFSSRFCSPLSVQISACLQWALVEVRRQMLPRDVESADIDDFSFAWVVWHKALDKATTSAQGKRLGMGRVPRPDGDTYAPVTPHHSSLLTVRA